LKNRESGALKCEELGLSGTRQEVLYSVVQFLGFRTTLGFRLVVFSVWAVLVPVLIIDFSKIETRFWFQLQQV
jgi:hypothetical protein